VEAVAVLPAAELRAEVARIVREEAAALSPEQQARVAAYLGQVPAMVRRSLRRPSDPSGTTTASGTVFRKPDDLAPLLPAGLPRFKAGDRPLPGVDWELVELLGVGGFGEVWKARNPHFDGRPPVALKFCLDPAAKARLLTHEAKIISQVMQQGKHEGIVSLLHTYLSADPPCLEYEYVEGGDLAGVIQGRRGGLTAANAAHVVRRLAEIVGFAHRMNPPVVHRDLKPANILATPGPGGKWRLRITDFGIGGLAIQQAVAQSRRSSNHGEFLTAAVRGSYTPLYGSPQQMRGEDPDPRDDVYALGVIWHQLLTGDLTTGRPGGDAWKKRLADRGMTPAWLGLLASCFEDRREDRPASAVELGAKLGRLSQAPAPGPSAYPEAIPLLDALPVETPKAVPPPPRPERPPAPKEELPRRVEAPKEGPRRRIEFAPVGVLFLALLIVGGLFWMIFANRPAPSTAPSPPPRKVSDKVALDKDKPSPTQATQPVEATITGMVRFNGMPVTGGTLTLYPSTGAPYPVSIKADGTYNTSGTPIGQMGVGIDTGPAPVAPPAGSTAPQGPRHVTIPPKYKNPKTSGLTLDIKGGKETIDFDLHD